MTLHIQCATPFATLLLAVDAPDGILRFPNDPSAWPGLGLKVDALLSINNQLKDRAIKELGACGSRIEIWQGYSSPMGGTSEEPQTTLYVARLKPTADEQNSLDVGQWSTLPALIRTLPKDRNRLAYLKAWQVLSGGLEETTKALDLDEVARHIKSLEKS